MCFFAPWLSAQRGACSSSRHMLGLLTSGADVHQCREGRGPAERVEAPASVRPDTAHGQPEPGADLSVRQRRIGYQQQEQLLLSVGLVTEARQAAELAVGAFERERREIALPEVRLLLARTAAVAGPWFRSRRAPALGIAGPAPPRILGKKRAMQH